MRRSRTQRPRLGAFALVASVIVSAPGGGRAAQAGPVQLIALDEDNTLILFDSSRPAEVKAVKVAKVSGALLGIDYRPANGRLYGISSANNLYTIDPATGAATAVNTLTLPFDGGHRSGFDFNPQSDRLRLVASNGQNLRVHPDVGATATDGALAYAARDKNFGKKPMVAGCAYTNSIARAPSTKTFDIDAALDVLALQEPPNDGILTTVGPLGVDFDVRSGFDILTEGPDRERAFAASGSTLYSIDLATGAATPLGPIGDGQLRLIGLAVAKPAGH